MKVKLVLRRPYGEIVFEGESLTELAENLKSLPEWLDIIDGLVVRSETPIDKKESLKGLIEYTNEGTLLTLPRDRINDEEAIGLILYANDPNLLTPREVARLLALSGRPSAGFGARLSELRNEGLVVKDGGAYRLSLTGKSWVEDLISKLKS